LANNGGYNTVRLAGWLLVVLTGLETEIVDWPASFHNGAGGLSFSDGHSEIHKWRGTAIRQPVTGKVILYGVPAGGSKNDIIWLSDITTVAK